MLSAKLSVAFLLTRLVPQPPRVKFLLFFIVTAWTVLHLFAVIFQCPLPTPWVSVPSRCHSHGKALYPAIVFNALTDILLSGWIIPIVWNLTTARKHLVSIGILFGLRICVCVPAIGQLVFLKSFFKSDDQTRSDTGRVLLNQATVYLSIICATIPRTNQFLSSLQLSGGMDMRVPVFQMNGMGTDKSTGSSSLQQDHQQLHGPVPSDEKDAQSDKARLRLVPRYDNVLRTIVGTGGDQKETKKATLPPPGGKSYIRKLAAEFRRLGTRNSSKVQAAPAGPEENVVFKSYGISTEVSGCTSASC
jgi:hypothetical protein